MALETSKDRILDAFTLSMGEDIANLLEDPNVTDLVKNADGRIWVKKLGVSSYVDTGYFMEAAAAEQIIYYVAHLSGATCNHDQMPRVSAELPGSGNRFQGTLPPVVATPTFAIRKKALLIFSLDDYVSQGILTQCQKDCVVAAVHSRKNIVIGGGTGSGKTTFANAVLKEMAKTKERIITIQDTVELQCTTENKLEMRTNDYVTMDDLLVDALRYHPKRIVIGEVRGKEALALIDAWGTGHPGGLCTVHCDSARNALSRIEGLIRRVSKDSQREAISEAVNVIVYIEELKEGRRIREIVEVKGFDGTNYILSTVA